MDTPAGRDEAAASEMAGTILYVEDDPDTCDGLAVLLRQAGYEVAAVTTLAEGMALAQRGGFGVILLDNWYPEGNGIELCTQIRGFDRQTPIVFYTAVETREDQEAARRAGAQAYVIKPHIRELFPVLAQLLAEGKPAEIFDN